MDLEYGEKYEEFRREVRTFLEDRASEKPPGGFFEGARKELTRWLSLQIEHGYWARTIPKEYGGYGAEPDLLETVIMDEEFNRAGISRGMMAQGPSMLVPTLLQHGTEEQKKKWVGPTMRGETIWWEYDGKTWAPISTETGPYSRSAGEMVWDSVRRKMLLHGGVSSVYNDRTSSWDYDGLHWLEFERQAWLPPNRDLTMAHDGLRGRTFVYATDMSGGKAATAAVDTWEFERQRASFANYGEGCIGREGLPRIYSTGRPELGKALSLDVCRVALGGTTYLAFSEAGSARQQILRTPCDLLIQSPVVAIVSRPSTSTVLSFSIPIPNWPSLRGYELHLQAGIIDSGANALNLVVSNAVRVVIY